MAAHEPLRGPSRRRRRWPAILALALLAIVAAACSATPGPRGWAGARPVSVEEPGLVLAAYKKTLYAIDPAQLSPLWQFPPENRDSYPISERSQDRIRDAIDALSIPDSEKESLRALVAEITISGDSIDLFKDAVDNSSATDDEKNDLNNGVDDITAIEEDAVRNVEAFYGDVGVSDDQQTAYAPGYGGWLYALNIETGETRWLVNVGDQMVGGVAVDDDRLYLGTKGATLFAIDPETGAAIDAFAGDGSFKVDDEIWSTPAVTEDAIYVTTMSGAVYAIDKSGQQRWIFERPSASIAMRPVVDGDTVYAGAFDKKLYAISATDGSERWRFEGDEWFWSAPVVRDGALFAASLDGKVYALSADDGSTRWERPFDAEAEVRAALTTGARGIVVAGRNGMVYQLDPATGEALSSLEAGRNIEADLTSDAAGAVYAVPRDPAVLFIIDTSSQLAATFFELPQ